jgi:mono/diheme cytochrome c family protein
MGIFFLLLRIIGLLVSVGILALLAFVSMRQNLKHDAPYPAVTASADSAVIARGRYLVRNVATCVGCHGDPGQTKARNFGEGVPLSGGFMWDIPPGKIYAKNITPDSTGIGGLSDGAVARALRHGVGHDGRALLPFMEMQGLSDDDLTAIVSYLRSQRPVPNVVPAHQFTALGKVVRATVLSKPIGPAETPPAVAPRGDNLENGRYLAGSVANCWACHTERNMATGQLTTARYSGARDMAEGNQVWAPPNLTPDPKTGRLTRMTEDQFVERMRAGRAIPDSPMPWEAYAGMGEEDLRAIYKFLMSLPPVEHDTGAPSRPSATG